MPALERRATASLSFHGLCAEREGAQYRRRLRRHCCDGGDTGQGARSGRGARPLFAKSGGDREAAEVKVQRRHERIGAAAESKGQRGRGAKSSPSVSPALNRSSPAQAIIAALSVQRAGGGRTRSQPVFAAGAASPWRRAALAA